MSKSTTVFLGIRKHPPFAMGGVALSLCLSLFAATPALSSTRTSEYTATKAGYQGCCERYPW